MPNQISGLLSPFLRKQRLIRACRHIHGRTLDFGCGVGVLARLLPPYRYVGIDRDPDSIALARSAHPTHIFFEGVNCAPIRQFAPFETIVALDVLEHISKRSKLLTHFEAILSPDGTLVITTPHPISRIPHRVGSYIGLFSREAEQEHGALIDRMEMERLLVGTQLRIELYIRFLFGMNQLFVIRRR
jgi:2-polyprenyl-3-methyl-5-hydroxy-6-metoxy-1,4-benzoquinol methylase